MENQFEQPSSGESLNHPAYESADNIEEGGEGEEKITTFSERKETEKMAGVTKHRDAMARGLIHAKETGDELLEEKTKEELLREAAEYEANITDKPGRASETLNHYHAKNAADCYRKAGEPEKAKKVWEGLLAVTFPRDYFNLGRIYKELGDQEKTKEMFAKAAADIERNNEVNDFGFAAGFHEEEGNLEKAEQLWRAMAKDEEVSSFRPSQAKKALAEAKRIRDLIEAKKQEKK